MLRWLKIDEVPWDLIVKAVEAVTDCPWVLLYVKRWLAAPLEHPDGTLIERSKGTPQGSAVSDRLREMRIHGHTNLSLDDLAGWLNPIIAGWMHYYGRF